jgi:flagellar FliL protein
LAEEEKVEKVAEGKKPIKPKMNLIVIIVLVILGIALAGAISFFVAVKISGRNQTTIVVVEKREPGQIITIGDEKDGVVLNIGGVTGRYLKIVVKLEVEQERDASGNKAPLSTQDEIKIKDAALKILRLQKIDAFTPEKQDALKNDIRESVNAALGANRVMALFITDLVIQ